ncbi:hypothetical protein PtA15_7A242 [Puccinia triticina]|uniref:Uncharacterized protein n=1 Tax=Puccinia triticina TaxID=208348 RepID=A0ABY7CQW0_9BASI|nr:uncharacterized protein PtA15_7A242 [Puccinia triticina]WAQ86516.1 hypothetical protein PtA15_7A242 [Puccinia triticina]
MGGPQVFLRFQWIWDVNIKGLAGWTRSLCQVIPLHSSEHGAEDSQVCFADQSETTSASLDESKPHSPISVSSNQVPKAPARWKPADQLNMTEMRAILSEHGVPVDDSLRRIPLMNVYNEFISTNTNEKGPLATVMDRAYLKKFLTDAGIPFNPKAHRKTLLKLYQSHLVSVQASNSEISNSQLQNSATGQPGTSSASQTLPASNNIQKSLPALNNPQSTLPTPNNQAAQPSISNNPPSLETHKLAEPNNRPNNPSTTRTTTISSNTSYHTGDVKRACEDDVAKPRSKSDLASLSSERLQQLLKTAGIKHRANARHATLVTLYHGHLIKANVKTTTNSAPLATVNKRLRTKASCPSDSAHIDHHIDHPNLPAPAPLSTHIASRSEVTATFPPAIDSNPILPVAATLAANNVAVPCGPCSSPSILSAQINTIAQGPAPPIPSDPIQYVQIADTRSAHVVSIATGPEIPLKPASVPATSIVVLASNLPPPTQTTHSTSTNANPSSNATHITDTENPASGLHTPSIQSSKVKRKRPKGTWPRPANMSGPEIQEILTEHQVPFDREDEKIMLARIYRSFIESTTAEPQLPCQKRLNTTEVEPKRHSRRKRSKKGVDQAGDPELNFVPKIPPVSQRNHQADIQPAESLLPVPIVPQDLCSGALPDNQKEPSDSSPLILPSSRADHPSAEPKVAIPPTPNVEPLDPELSATNHPARFERSSSRNQVQKKVDKRKRESAGSPQSKLSSKKKRINHMISPPKPLPRHKKSRRPARRPSNPAPLPVIVTHHNPQHRKSPPPLVASSASLRLSPQPAASSSLSATTKHVTTTEQELSKHKRKHAQDEWPRPSTLSPDEIQEILIRYCVNFNPDNDIITLSRLYRSLMKSHELSPFGKQPAQATTQSTGHFTHTERSQDTVNTSAFHAPARSVAIEHANLALHPSASTSISTSANNAKSDKEDDTQHRDSSVPNGNVTDNQTSNSSTHIHKDPSIETQEETKPYKASNVVLSTSDIEDNDSDPEHESHDPARGIDNNVATDNNDDLERDGHANLPPEDEDNPKYLPDGHATEDDGTLEYLPDDYTDANAEDDDELEYLPNDHPDVAQDDDDLEYLPNDNTAVQPEDHSNLEGNADVRPGDDDDAEYLPNEHTDVRPEDKENPEYFPDDDAAAQPEDHNGLESLPDGHATEDDGTLEYLPDDYTDANAEDDDKLEYLPNDHPDAAQDDDDLKYLPDDNTAVQPEDHSDLEGNAYVRPGDDDNAKYLPDEHTDVLPEDDDANAEDDNELEYLPDEHPDVAQDDDDLEYFPDEQPEDHGDLEGNADVRPEDDDEDIQSSSRFNVEQMKARLKQHQVTYKTQDNRARIVELYDAMRTRLITIACHKQRHDSEQRCKTAEPTSKLAEQQTNKPKNTNKSQHGLKSKPTKLKQRSRARKNHHTHPDKNPSPPTSPPLLFSERVVPGTPDSSRSSMQSIVYNYPENPGLRSSPIQSPPQDMSIDKDSTAHDEYLDNEPSNLFRWQTSEPLDNREADQGSSKMFNLIQSYVRQSSEFGNKIINRMDGMIETMQDLSISMQASSSGALSTTLHNGKGKSKATTDTETPQGGEFPRLIRQHIATLLGSKSKKLPHHDDDTRMDIDELSDDAEISDPDYPYPDGPGGPAAGPQTLSIMRRMMNEAGVRSFRPDFTQPIDSPDNEHLLDLAVKIFMELVRCKEYTGVDPEILKEETIRNAIYVHVTQRLRRRYREENKWTEDQQATAAKDNRRHSRLVNL